MKGIGMAGFATGMAQTPAAIVDAQRQGAERADARALAMMKYEEGMFDLQRKKAAVPAEDARLNTMEAQYKVLHDQYLQLGRQQVLQDSWRATDAYLEQFDVRHINHFFRQQQNNPLVPEEFKDVVRMDKADKDSAQGRELVLKGLRKHLQRAGQDPSSLQIHGDTIAYTDEDGEIHEFDMETLTNRFLIVTRPTGEQDVADLFTFGILSGYPEYARGKELERLESLANISQKQRGAYRGETDLVRYARALSEEQNIPYEEALIIAWETRGGGVDAGKGLLASRAREEALQETGGDQTLLGQLKEYNRGGGNARTDDTPEATALRQKVSQLGSKLTPAQQTALSEAMRGLAILHDGFNLSPETQGFIDSPLNAVREYFTDKDRGQTNRQNYQAFINNDLISQHGKTLTKYEMDRFFKAYGNDRQTMSTVLNGMASLLRARKADAEAATASLPPELREYYFGDTLAQLEDRIIVVDARVQFYQKVAQLRSSGSSESAAVRKAAQELNIPINKDGTVELDLSTARYLGEGGTDDTEGTSLGRLKTGKTSKARSNF